MRSPERAKKGYPLAWAAWVFGVVCIGGAAGSVSADHPTAAHWIVLGLIVASIGHAINVYYEPT